MNKHIEMILEASPVNVSHDTYRRECRYTRGIHIEEQEFLAILNSMSHDSRLYFDFHNPRKEIKKGTYLNGHSGLAYNIYDYYKQNYNIEISELINGKDFYVKIV
ncbi:hypothetical protein JIN86_22570 [Lysinibacillus sp. HST-98]|uniref:hypothetical protein n=1 Tax=Lysinibacillus TaxID=400634 RepID=UPI0001DA551D|nr:MULTISPECIES: hypothetical protein [Lysinibacillus]EFI69050.1 hypothetical protein BFZC1_08595 [Lysinibacillus fusiformis ZC1]EKU41852.1 hypothetical protein C518_3158 [Lysinibacillus fusiformis ZB2]WHP40262.1 hypothetical protein QIX46_16920 [Lysinibacillus boronitolerans]MBL3732330.1 hypothetical protein [Lysinibacillus sp. HST-98]MBU5254554.1 hypothetical protein [Lysinibacillus capsici]